jgi:hypothetical protein
MSAELPAGVLDERAQATRWAIPALAAELRRADETLRPSYAAWVLGIFRNPRGKCIRPGDFHTDLIHVIAKADPVNKQLLHRAYPALVECVMLYQGADDGVAELEAIAGREWVTLAPAESLSRGPFVD